MKKEAFHGSHAMKDRNFNFGNIYNIGHAAQKTTGDFANTDNRPGTLKKKAKARHNSKY